MAPQTKRKSAAKAKPAKPRAKPGSRRQLSPRTRVILKWLIICGVWCFIALGLLVGWYASELPKVINSTHFDRRPAVTFKAADGVVFDHYGDLKGETLTIKQLPPHLVDAVLATEDRRFYKHHGVDPIGMLRAAGADTLRGHVVQGGSTITQQLAKNLFLNQERTFKRKIQEMLLALWLEHHLTKDDILSAYLNRVYLGNGAYGVDAAAHLYFNKSARDVNLRESAVLAGMLKAPSRYSPEKQSGPRRATGEGCAERDGGSGIHHQGAGGARNPDRPDAAPETRARRRRALLYGLCGQRTG